ncbi:Stp1/IreP family PP2C-type Ser/Thr phosphatase [Microbulbifer yueqingensis]|uniref:Protein phosphatase n=1 Tax=Microbulbifer yueqingensis TaxID=658219 RepID=A0A1G8W0V3_9GAMM|nr:Stp1/IreP family PP2C-type Ser/Thr phosphatase [Microbulbifer yueqingensis]SDJ71879.1 protein phosphatase [Microbulbifer yueqingensis]
MTSVRLAVDGRSDIGLFREDNEDRVFCYEDTHHPFAYVILADGMGGHRGGAMASEIATRSIHNCLDQVLSESFLASPAAQQEELLKSTMTRAIDSANQQILEAKKSNPEYARMGTTVVAAAIWNDYLVVAHVGDSRAYHWSGRRLQRLTRDHSFVQELIDSGQLSEEEGRKSRLRNQLTSALGITEEVSPSILARRLTDYSLLLLCSDGLTDYLDDPQLEKILNTHRPALSCTHRFIDEANRMGGKDNISAGMIEFQREAG